ncbi:dihydrolipoamide acetyltransferase family protein [uncultured Roseibium sp.]|uniref:dihydrolipoamide acetyltransferase family protein n=1 Tax=uncultured Roseibium sp. TaxID=1936171 RepID=UPI003217A4F3
MAAFVMPSLGSDMDAGTLVEWLKKPGDEVHRGDIVAVVEPQKGAIEIESFQEGILTGYLTDLGRKVPVGTPLAVIKEEGKDDPEDEALMAGLAPSAETPPVQNQTPVAVAKTQVGKAPPSAGARLKISPAAGRLAQAPGIDRSALTGTGPQGSIVLADVMARLEQKRGPGLPGTKVVCEGGEQLTGMRAAIAAAMAHSKREIPHYYLSQTINLTSAEQFIASANADRVPENRLLLGAVYAKAVALACRKFPEFNGHFEEVAFHASDTVHAGMAINIRGGGLVAPAIHNAETLDLDTLMDKMRDLVVRVRAGRFRAAELSDPTITVSSLGDRGVDSLYGVIYPPQVAIVGFGTPVIRPWEQDGEVALKRVVTLTLAADHRVSDGHSGARFLNAIEKYLIKPEEL